VITFSGVLQHEVFPLAGILNSVLKMGQEDMGRPVEIEFAVNLEKGDDGKITGQFYLLQLRPIVDKKNVMEENLRLVRKEDCLLQSIHALGHGIINDVYDIVYVKTEEFSASNNLLIADEIQTGFGRTGKMFGCEHFGLEPDIMVLGKAIASGMPLSAIVGRKEILEAWQTPQHFMSVGGNPMCCVAAIETISIIEDEKLSDNANKQGRVIMNRFLAMKDKYQCIGDVRGTGLLIGVDIVEDRLSKERARDKTAKICWRCWENGLLLAFFANNVVRVAPPLTINDDEVRRALDIVEQAIADVENGLVPDSVLDEIQGW
jgi:4-aminobutyrate aminotransferase